MRARVARILFVWFLLILLFPCSRSVGQDLDDAQLSRLPPGISPTRWENVEHDRHYICGEKPKRVRRYHVVTLEPGQSTTVRVAPHGSVRVLPISGVDTPHDVELWWSDGSGLYRKLHSGIAQHDGSLLGSPGYHEVSVAKIARPDCYQTPIQVAIFTSRYLQLPFADGYHVPVFGCTESVMFTDRKGGSRGSFRFSKLTKDCPVSIEVKGPARLEFDTRYIYEKEDWISAQPYRIYVTDNAGPRRLLEFETTSDMRRHVHADGWERGVGKRSVAYLDIEDGKHRIELDSTANLFLRVRKLECHSYGRPMLNSPRWAQRQMPSATQPNQLLSIWDIRDGDIEAGLATLQGYESSHLALAMRSGRDNRYRRGGLRSYLLMRAAAARRPDDPRIRIAAENLRAFHTFWRSVPPQWQPEGVRPIPAYFVTRKIRRPTDDQVDVILPEQLTEDALDRGVSKGQFVRLSGGPQQAAVFALPEQLGQTQVRLVVDDSSISAFARIYMQLDRGDQSDHLPMQFLATPGNPLQLGQYFPSRGETGLASQHWKTEQIDSGTLGGPFARGREPGRLLRVGVNELLIPEGVRMIRVWSHCRTKGCGPRVAIQYREAKPYQLTERAYLNFLRRTGRRGVEIAPKLLRGEPRFGNDAYAAIELCNHWIPLNRLLQSHYEEFRRGVTPIPDSNLVSIDQPNIDGLVRKAQELTQNRLWLAAIDAWTVVYRSTKGHQQNVAAANRLQALFGAGETYLAKQSAHSVILNEDDPELIESAIQLLWEYHLADGNFSGLEQVAALAVRRNPSPANLTRLVNALFDNGRFREALTVAHCISADKRPTRTVMRAAYQEGWWLTYNEAAAQIRTREAQNFALGLRDMRWNDFDSAVNRLSAAGPDGAAMLAHQRWGEEILSQLKSKDRSQREAALSAWEEWQAQHPGPRTWREESAPVRSSAGTLSLYSVDRDLYGQRHKAAPRLPLRLSVQGPVDLSLRMRPLHHKGNEIPIQDWITIQTMSSGKSERMGKRGARLVPVIENYATDGLQIAANPTMVPGTLVETEMRLGPGRHNIEIEPEKFATVVNVRIKRPEYQLPALPPITLDTVDAVMRGCFGHEQERHFCWSTKRAFANRDVVAHIVPRDNCPNIVRQSYMEFGPHTHCRAMGCTDSSCTGQSCTHPTCTGEACEDDFFVEEQSKTDGSAYADWNAGPANETAIEKQQRQVAEADLGAALDVDPNGDPNAAANKASMLLYMAEMAPAKRDYCVAEIHALERQFPNLSAIVRVRRLLTRQSSWMLRREFDGSAGLYTRKISGWDPENPLMRVRKALLNADRADALISGNRVMVLSVENVLDSEFHFTVTAVGVDALLNQPIELQWAVNHEPPQKLTLSRPGESQQIKLALPAGQHRVRLWQSNPYQNQFVAVTIRETDATTRLRAALEPTKRLYHVATETAPVSFVAHGPAYLRIDELRIDAHGNQSTQSQYHVVQKDSTRFHLRPVTGQQRALFRVFELKDDPTRVTSPTLRARRVLNPVAPSWLNIASGGRSPTPLRLRKSGDMTTHATKPQEIPVENALPAVQVDDVRSTEMAVSSASAEQADESQVALAQFVDTTHSLSASNPLPPSSSPIPRSIVDNLVTFEPNGALYGDGLGQLALLRPDADPQALNMYDHYRLGQEDGTWGFHGGYVHRRPLEEAGRAGDPDRFFELGATHYQHDYWSDRYFNTSRVARIRQIGGRSIGLRHSGCFEVPAWWTNIERNHRFPFGSRDPYYKIRPFNFAYGVYGYGQLVDSDIPRFDGNLEWSMGFSTSASRQWDLAARFHHIPSITFFFRYLSMENNPYEPGVVDQDIFTEFKNDHRGGFIVSDSFVFEKHLDRRWWFRPSLYTNENMSPDHVSMSFGHDRLEGPILIRGRYRFASFFKDEDREDTALQHIFYLTATFERWRNAGFHWQLSANLSHEVVTDETSAGLLLTIFKSRGRGYWDFPPKRTLFRRLRIQRYMKQWSHEPPTLDSF